MLSLQIGQTQTTSIRSKIWVFRNQNLREVQPTRAFRYIEIRTFASGSSGAMAKLLLATPQMVDANFLTTAEDIMRSALG